MNICNFDHIYQRYIILSITSNHTPADFAIDCITLHGCKGATGCDVTPTEFLSSCM